MIVPEEIAERLASLECLYDPDTTVIFGLKSREERFKVWDRHDPALLWKTCHTKNYWCYRSMPRSMPLSSFIRQLQTRFPNLKFLPWENCAGVTASIASIGESSYIPLALKLGVEAAILAIEDGYLEKARVYARACSDKGE